MGILKTMLNMAVSADLQGRLDGPIAQYKRKGYQVQHIEHRRATLFKKGLLWNSTVTLHVTDDGRVEVT